MYVSGSFVRTNVWSSGRFVPPMFCPSGHFVPPDVNHISGLSVSGDFFPPDVTSPDVTSPDVTSPDILSGHPYISTGTQNKFQILNIVCTYDTFIAGFNTIGHS
jgi:hypothetical protein